MPHPVALREGAIDAVEHRVDRGIEAAHLGGRFQVGEALSEIPEVIRAEIMVAAKGAIEIGDRAQAIRTAVGMLKTGDTLIVAGKGHEEGQTVGSVTLPFSDHAEVRKALGGL